MGRRALRLSFAVVLCLGAVTPGSAQQALTIEGYAKNIVLQSISSLSGKPFFLNVGRHRAILRAQKGARITAESWFDTEVLYGSFLHTQEYALTRNQPNMEWLQLNWRVASGRSVEVRQQLFRAFVTVYAGQSSFAIGRQRIAWGTGLAWNPTDVINPSNPGAIELSEKAGIDAAYMSMHTGSSGRVELVVARADKTIIGARSSTNYRHYDLSGMAAIIGRDWILGGDFAGYLGGAGLRGEAAYRSGTNAVRLVLNSDYSFSPRLYGLVEYYYNGEGVAHKSAYGDVDPSRTFSLARHYAVFSISTPISLLMNSSFYAITNMNDGGMLVGPAMHVSLARNAELSVSTYFFLGPNDTEFGSRHHVYFASLQWYY